MADITVEYVDHLGDDLRVVNAARVSFNKQAEMFGDKDAGLIKYLARHNHFTPFTHCSITLRETVPIFVARQRFKHLVGFTYNEVSRRYVDDAPEFYVPEVWRSRPEGSVKQGSGTASIEQITLKFEGDSREHEVKIGQTYASLIEHANTIYDCMLASGVAPEMARMVLPQSMMTSYYVTGSLAAFARAYKQRSDSHAQKEIQDLAAHWDNLIRPLFPQSWSALVDDQ